ncbi:WYL domain-containing protein [Algoriphagus marinus]|uniref:hypothetical protein n=1 Tax=Algoriphagus marinus TaxID=1925762 RepID=UPI00094BA5DE|nr:hypothetical protein [Algoriphagus marinus]
MITLSIGDTVAFKSHPYHSTSDGKLITSEIIGEHLMTPPLMVVIETLHHFKGSYDDKSGNEILPKKSHSAKCLWYNSSLHQFEETWIHQNELKKLPCESDPSPINSEEYNDWKAFKSRLVSLKTLKQELGKEKRSIRKEGANKRDQVTHYLEFVSPVMELLEIKKFEIKEAQFDPKNGERKKGFPKFVAKCKWYNPKGSKYSERFIPLEALNLIPEIEIEKFDLISKIKDEGIFIYLPETNKKYLFKPNILFKSGYYYLTGYNLLSNEQASVLLVNDQTLIMVENPFDDNWPKFDAANKLIQKEDFIKANLKEEYWIIKYENYHGEVTTRTIVPKSIGTDEVLLEGVKSTVNYLIADCQLRNAERNFRFERIRSIQVIKLPEIPASIA